MICESSLRLLFLCVWKFSLGIYVMKVIGNLNY